MNGPSYTETCAIMLPADPPSWLILDPAWWAVVVAISGAGAFQRVIQIGALGTHVVCTVSALDSTGSALQASCEATDPTARAAELSAWLRTHMQPLILSSHLGEDA